MDFFSKLTKTEQSKPVSDDNQEPNNSQPGFNSDLFNSAKVVTGAAQSYFTHQPESNYDNAEVAGATADLLKAGSEYGKLDGTQGVGKYVNQAENYLNEYKTSHTTSATATTTDTGVDGGDNSIPTAKITTTDEFSDKVPTSAGGDEDVKGGTDDASDEYDRSEGGHKAADGLSSKTAGDGGFASTEDDFSTDDKKLYGGQTGGGYEEDTEEVFSKKPTSGVGTTVGTDASDKYEQQSQVDDYTAEDNYTKKPSGGVTAAPGVNDEYDQSGDGYENKNKSDDFSYTSSGGADAKVAESAEGSYEEDTAEGNFSNKVAAAPGSYSTTGDDVSENRDEESEGGGYGNFAKAAAADFLKK